MPARACFRGHRALRMAARACFRGHSALQMAARGCLRGHCALKMAARACLGGDFEAAVRSNCLLGRPHARNGCSKSPLEVAARSHRSKSLLGITVRNFCLCNTKLYTTVLCSALLRAWICTGSHKHIIYILVYIERCNAMQCNVM